MKSHLWAESTAMAIGKECYFIECSVFVRNLDRQKKGPTQESECHGNALMYQV